MVRFRVLGHIYGEPFDGAKDCLSNTMSRFRAFRQDGELISSVLFVFGAPTEIQLLICCGWFARQESRSQRCSSIDPLVGLRHGSVEIVYEAFDLRAQVMLGQKAASFEHLAHQYPEPDFNLIEPRTMLGRVNEPDSVAWVRKKVSPAYDVAENPMIALLSKVAFVVDVFGHEPHETL